MLKTYAAFFSLIRSVADLAIVSTCWVTVYFIRFYCGAFSTEKGIPTFDKHLLLIIPVVCLSYVSCLWSGLYKPKRTHSTINHLAELLKASLLSGLFILAFFYYINNAPYSRTLLTMFIIMQFLGLFSSHFLVLWILRYFRRKGYNLRYYAVIGTGKKARQLVMDIQKMDWAGLKCHFFVDNNPAMIGTQLLSVPVYGPVSDIVELTKTHHVDEIYVALNGMEMPRIFYYLDLLQIRGVTIRIIPGWGNLLSVSKPVVFFVGSQILFSASDSPQSGFRVIIKRIFDIIVAFILCLVFLIPMISIALLIKATTRGPIFYKQIRMGLDQREFEIFKFRTMIVEAENDSGPRWSTTGDSRCTPIGKWLRKMSLDELPQLINVLKGDLSLVGPRPERPHFVKHFSDEYRRYMLRHKVKPGITGWAQVNGFRGNTSLRKRLIYDLYYIQNWSPAFDIWILLRTPWHVLKGENAH